MFWRHVRIPVIVCALKAFKELVPALALYVPQL